MREIIGEMMEKPLLDFGIKANLTYRGVNGLWKLQVWQMSDEEYKKLCNIDAELLDFSDSEWCKKYDGSWWRGADGSNQRVPCDAFCINGKRIIAWRNEQRIDDLEADWFRMSADEQAEYGSLDSYVTEWLPDTYSSICDYLCCELGVSTERNVCALVTDLAKYNNMTISELLETYGGANKISYSRRFNRDKIAPNRFKGTISTHEALSDVIPFYDEVD